MDFSYTDEQNMLCDSVSRLMQQRYDFDSRQAIVKSDQPWSPDIWRALGELGLFALPFSEEAGGLGGSICDSVAICEIFGAHLMVEPYASSTLLAGRILEASGKAKAHEKVGALLSGIIEGKRIVAFAHEEGKGTSNPALVACSAKREAGGYRLNGEKRMVLAGAEADTLLVTAQLEEETAGGGCLAVFLVPAELDGVSVTPFPTIDGRSAAHVLFDNIFVEADGLISDHALDMVESATNAMIVALCAEAVGAMGALFDLTSEYANTRKQFGKSIIGFQAIAHRLANMKIAHIKLRSCLTYTTALLEAGRATNRDISVLKAQVGKLGHFIGESAIQIHGGVGMTDELSVGHYHKRLLTIDALFGNSAYHFRVLGAE